MGIDHIDGRQMQRFKTLLELRRQELHLSIEHQLQYARKAEPEPDAVDQATSGYERESVLERTKKEQQLLQTIESALVRIGDGSFGKCLSCGNEIDVKRLQAVPWTRHCIQCQEDFER
jgi:DnaK suppressor protein